VAADDSGAEEGLARTERLQRDWARRLGSAGLRCDSDPRYHTTRIPREYGKQAERDAALKAIFDGSVEAGAARRAAEARYCAQRLAKLNDQHAAAVHTPDSDRVASRLVESLETLEQKQGGASVRGAFKIIGEARVAAELVGKTSQPRGGSSGIRQVRRDDARDGELITDEVEVLEHVQLLADRANAPRGGSVRALTALIDLLREPDDDGDGAEAAQAAAAEQGLTGGDAVDVMEEGRSDAALERMREVQGVGVDRFMGFYLRRAPSEVRRRYLQAMRETADDLQSASELPRETKKQRTARREAVRAAAPAAWTQYVGVLLPKPGEDAALFGRKRDVWLQPHGLKLFMLTLKPVSMTWRWSGTYRCARRASGRAATRRRRRWCWRWRGSRRMWSGAASTADSSISADFSSPSAGRRRRRWSGGRACGRRCRRL